MKFARRILIGMAVVVAISLAAALLSRQEPEPRFDGKPLSDWIWLNLENYPARNPVAAQALRAMGPEAVRNLAEWVEREDSFLRRKIMQHGNKLAVLNENLPSKYWVRWAAAMALAELGTNAAAAVPALEKLAADPEPNLASAAQAVLLVVKNEGMGNLLKDYLDYSNRTNSIRAFGLLRTLGPSAGEAVPVLLGELGSTNNRVRQRAVLVLSNVGIESEACVAAMTNLLSDEDAIIRYSAADTLANSGSLAMSAVPLVARLLEDQEDLCRSSAVMFLGKPAFSNEFIAYKSAVQRMTNDPSETVRICAKAVLTDKQGSRK